MIEAVDDPQNVADESRARSGRRYPPVIWPLVTLLLATPLLVWLNVDLLTANYFFEADRWIFARQEFWDSVDRVCPLLGVVLAIVSLVVLVLGYVRPKLRRHELATTFLVLAAVIGPFLIVNCLLKATWGRPRPSALVQFGGEYEHCEPWRAGERPDIHKSFPSGHAAIGFYLIAPAFLVYRRRPILFGRLFTAGALYGGFMSLSRVMQGAHFVTDIVWAAGIVYLTCALLYRWLDPESAHEAAAAPNETTEFEGVSDQPLVRAA